MNNKPKSQPQAKATGSQPDLIQALLARTQNNPDRAVGERYVAALERWASSGGKKATRYD